jgi:hypothetical protein
MAQRVFHDRGFKCKDAMEAYMESMPLTAFRNYKGASVAAEKAGEVHIALRKPKETMAPAIK